MYCVLAPFIVYCTKSIGFYYSRNDVDPKMFDPSRLRSGPERTQHPPGSKSGLSCLLSPPSRACAPPRMNALRQRSHRLSGTFTTFSLSLRRFHPLHTPLRRAASTGAESRAPRSKWVTASATLLVLSAAGAVAYETYQPFRYTVLAGVRCSRVAGEFGWHTE
jgi:hypothetical protein